MASLCPRLSRLLAEVTQPHKAAHNSKAVRSIEEYLSDPDYTNLVYVALLEQAQSELISGEVLLNCISLLKRFLISYVPSADVLLKIEAFCTSIAHAAGVSSDVQRSVVYLQMLLAKVVSQATDRSHLEPKAAQFRLNRRLTPIHTRVASDTAILHPSTEDEFSDIGLSMSRRALSTPGGNTRDFSVFDEVLEEDSAEGEDGDAEGGSVGHSHGPSHSRKVSRGSSILDARTVSSLRSGIIEDVVQYRWMDSEPLSHGSDSELPVSKIGVPGVASMLLADAKVNTCIHGAGPSIDIAVRGIIDMLRQEVGQAADTTIAGRTAKTRNTRPPLLFDHASYSEQAPLDLSQQDVAAVVEAVCGKGQTEGVWEDIAGLWKAPAWNSGGLTPRCTGEVCANILIKLVIDMWLRSPPENSLALTLSMLSVGLADRNPSVQCRTFDVIFNLSVHSELLFPREHAQQYGDAGGVAPKMGNGEVVENGLRGSTDSLGDRLSNQSTSVAPSVRDSIDNGDANGDKKKLPEFRQWLRLLLFQCLLLIAHRDVAEEVWSSAFGCLVALCFEQGALRMERLKGVPLRAIAALVDVSSRFRWPQSICTIISQLAVNLVYTPLAGNGGQQSVVTTTGVGLSLKRLEELGGVRFVVQQLKLSLSAAARRNWFAVIFDFVLLQTPEGHVEPASTATFSSPDSANHSASNSGDMASDWRADPVRLRAIVRMLLSGNMVDAFHLAFLYGGTAFRKIINRAINWLLRSDNGRTGEVRIKDLHAIMDGFEAVAAMVESPEPPLAIRPVVCCTLQYIVDGLWPGASQSTNPWEALRCLLHSHNAWPREVARSWLQDVMSMCAECCLAGVDEGWRESAGLLPGPRDDDEAARDAGKICSRVRGALQAVMLNAPKRSFVATDFCQAFGQLAMEVLWRTKPERIRDLLKGSTSGDRPLIKAAYTALHNKCNESSEDVIASARLTVTERKNSNDSLSYERELRNSVERVPETVRPTMDRSDSARSSLDRLGTITSPESVSKTGTVGLPPRKPRTNSKTPRGVSDIAALVLKTMLVAVEWIEACSTNDRQDAYIQLSNLLLSMLCVQVSEDPASTRYTTRKLRASRESLMSFKSVKEKPGLTFDEASNTLVKAILNGNVGVPEQLLKKVPLLLLLKLFKGVDHQQQGVEKTNLGHKISDIGNSQESDLMSDLRVVMLLLIIGRVSNDSDNLISGNNFFTQLFNDPDARVRHYASSYVMYRLMSNSDSRERYMTALRRLVSTAAASDEDGMLQNPYRQISTMVDLNLITC